jgi:hypothetical protein
VNLRGTRDRRCSRADGLFGQLCAFWATGSLSAHRAPRRSGSPGRACRHRGGSGGSRTCRGGRCPGAFERHEQGQRAGIGVLSCSGEDLLAPLARRRRGEVEEQERGWRGLRADGRLREASLRTRSRRGRRRLVLRDLVQRIDAVGAERPSRSANASSAVSNLDAARTTMRRRSRGTASGAASVAQRIARRASDMRPAVSYANASSRRTVTSRGYFSASASSAGCPFAVAARRSSGDEVATACAAAPPTRPLPGDRSDGLRATAPWSSHRVPHASVASSAEVCSG